MSIWGKIAGAAAGFALGGGPLGALVGALAGHLLVDTEGSSLAPLEGDGLRDRSQEPGGIHFSGPQPDAPPPDAAFAIAVVALFAKMAKADGVVTRDEIDVFKRVFQVAPEDIERVGKLFNLAKQDISGYDAYARQVSQIFRNKPGMLADLMEALFLIAAADHTLHPAEEAFLQNIAEIFGISNDHYGRLREAQFGPDRADPYKVLGVPADAPLADVKRAYHAAVRENHPDALMARGVPPDFIKIANDKLALINGAYEKIRKGKGDNTAAR